MRIEGRIIVRVPPSLWTHPALNSMSIEGRVSTILFIMGDVDCRPPRTSPLLIPFCRVAPLAYVLTFAGVRRVHERGHRRGSRGFREGREAKKGIG